ncbi:Hypothetical protein NocV09_02001190 [Nannochloropsis oceanica]
MPLQPGFRPFKSLREVCGNVSLELDEDQRALIGPPTSQFFAGFRLRELDETNQSTFLKEAGRVQQGLRGLVWFAYLLWPYIGFGIFCSLIAQVIVYNRNGLSAEDATYLTPLDVKDFPDLKIVHGFVGSILGFSIGFRTNAAYDRYYEGRKILSTILENSRSIIRDVYSFILKTPSPPSFPPSPPLSAPDDAAVEVVSDDIRRRLNVLFAFVRQSVRESLIGFSPDSDMAAVPFINTTYYLDPSFPQLLDLLSKDEAIRYARLSPRSRPGAVSAEINIILQILGARIQYVDAFLGKVQGHLGRITEAHSTMLRIRDTPVPYPYLLILNVATFIFVYSTPFLYNTGIEGRYLGVQLLVIAYYGILSIGQSIENPYAWDTFDIDFEDFAIQLSRDLSATASCLKDDRSAFLQELVHPHEEEKEEEEEEEGGREGRGK